MGRRMSKRTLYFAFGSNLDRWQMRQRCPGARIEGAATLPKHRLVFGGFSRRWDSAVASIVRDAASCVPGMLYTLGDDDLEALDRFEGVPGYYERVTRYVVDAQNQRRRAHVYQLPEAQLVTGTPGFPYFDTIRRAYERLGFDRRILVEAAYWEVA
jgi:gamma-glutamylcyclotransferase (GGCT)/AIG2-like uncharacterized protein YtfP